MKKKSSLKTSLQISHKDHTNIAEWANMNKIVTKSSKLINTSGHLKLNLKFCTINIIRRTILFENC